MSAFGMGGMSLGERLYRFNHKGHGVHGVFVRGILNASVADVLVCRTLPDPKTDASRFEGAKLRPRLFCNNSNQANPTILQILIQTKSSELDGRSSGVVEGKDCFLQKENRILFHAEAQGFFGHPTFSVMPKSN